MAKITTEKKPPYFSKEAREAREQNKSIETIENVKPIETPKEEKIVETKTQDPSLKAILERLEKQEAELKLLKGDKDINKDAKEKYKWPRKYAFSLWTGIPVLNIEYYLKDEEADLVYQNVNGQRVENQYVRLTLLWGKVAETSNYLYNKNKAKSDHFFAKTNTDENGETTYTFNEPKYWEFTVLSSKFIN